MQVVLKVERAVARYLLSVAPWLVGKDGSYIIADNGLVVQLTSGTRFEFPILTGQSVCEVTAPNIVVYCPEASQDSTTECTLNHTCTIDVALSFPADATDALGNPAESLACWEYAANGLVQALYRGDLGTQLQLAEPDLTILHVNKPRTQRSGFEDRNRVFRVEFTLVATPVNLIP